MILPEDRGMRSGGCRGRQTGDETVPAAQIPMKIRTYRRMYYMINGEKLLLVIAAYKEYFPNHWKDEMYK